MAYGQHVVFRIGEEQYGLPIHFVKEIQRSGSVTEIPHAPSYIRGLANLRGNVITVVCGRRLLGLPGKEASQNQRILLLKNSSRLLGLLVDGLSGVPTVKPEKTYPYMSSGASGWISGLAFTDNGWFVRLLDMDKLFELMRREENEGSGRINGRLGVNTKRFAEIRLIEQKMEQYVRFQTKDGSFAVPVHQVRDIQPMPETIEPLTGAPAAVIGLAAVRERIIPIFDAGMLMEQSFSDSVNRVIVMEINTSLGKSLIGIAVQQATEVLRIPRETVAEVPPALRKYQGNWVTGLYRDEKSFVYILDVSRANFTDELSIMIDGKIEVAECHTNEARDREAAADQVIAPPSSTFNTELSTSDALYLLFQMKQETYAIPVKSVKEILRVSAVTRIPHAGSLVTGITNIRGNLVTVINLQSKLSDYIDNGLSGERLVVLQAGQRVRAFLVDRVIGLRRADCQGLEYAQGLRQWLPEQEELLSGMVELESDQMAIVLNPERVCSLD